MWRLARYYGMRKVVGTLMESGLYLTLSLNERNNLVRRVYYMMFNM